MRPAMLLTVHVDCSAGGWEVEVPGQRERIRCETLGDAKRVAYLSAAHCHAFKLVVRDAYHRVLDEEFVAGDVDSRLCAPAGRASKLRATGPELRQALS